MMHRCKAFPHDGMVLPLSLMSTCLSPFYVAMPGDACMPVEALPLCRCKALVNPPLEVVSTVGP